MNLETRVATLEKLTESTDPVCEAIFFMGQLDGDRWQGVGLEVHKGHDESDEEFKNRTIQAIIRHTGNNTVSLWKMLGEILPG